MKNIKLIKTDLYLLLIDEEAEIYQMDLYLDVDCDTVTRATLTSDQYSGCKKVIAYYPLTKEAKELDLPLLPNPFENNFDLKQEIIRWYHSKTGITLINDPSLNTLVDKAQSKQFSLEDMYRVAIKVTNRVSRPEYGEIININEIVDTYIQSLSTQRLPLSFEPEIELVLTDIESDIVGDDGECIYINEERLKTIINPEGRKELVGTYKY